MNNKFFEVTVSVVVSILKNGKPKEVKEVYLVDAMTVTEAEARVVQSFVKSSQNMDYKVISAKESRILQVIES